MVLLVIYDLMEKVVSFSFFEESGGARGSYCKCIKRNKEYSYKIRIGGNRNYNCSTRLIPRKLGNRERKEENPKNYKLELIHDSKRGMSLALHLCNKRSASTVIQDLQSSTEGFLFLKITSFLIIQIPQQKIMKISRENSICSIDF